MHENKYNKLADKGWNGMESILDKEMPVKADRRWLFFFLLFAFAVGASALFVLSRTSEREDDRMVDMSELKDVFKENEVNSELLNRKIGKQKAKNIGESILSPTRDQISQKVVGNLEEKKVQNERLSTSRQNNKLEANTPIGKESNIEAFPSFVEVNVRSDGEIRESLIDLNDDDMSSNRDVSKGSVVGKAGFDEGITEDFLLTIEEGRANKNEVATIINREIRNIDFKEEFKGLDASLTTVEVRHPLYMSIYGGYSLPLASQISGPYAGFEVGKNLSRRWIWSANLGVNMATNNFKQSFSQQDERAVFDPTEIQSDPNLDIPDGEVLVVGVTNGGVSLNQQYYDLVAERIGHLYYLDLGLNASYSLSQKHEVGVGLNYSYLVSSVTDYISLSEFANSLALSNGGLRRDVLIQANLINRHNISLTGRYQYHVSKRLDLHLRFNLGLNQIIKVQEVSDYRNRLNYLGIGLGYKLKV